MKKSAKLIESSKSKNLVLFRFIKLIFGLVLGLFSYYLLSQSDKTIKLNLDPILPPNGTILKSIAIPRVSGTLDSAKVRQFIKSQFDSKFWEIEEDSHVMNTAHGQSTEFVNLIITLKTRKVSSEKRLILAAHYDSKLLEAEGKKSFDFSKQSEFIGATDSAWSCALMIALARAIQAESKKKLKQNFQLIFFDGEEAVQHWSKTDSLYGSRALALKWSKLSKESFNSLDKINLMILLDLLGSKDATKIYSFHSDNSFVGKEFKKLIEIEGEYSNDPSIFQESNQFKHLNGLAIEDDHTPFLPFKVPVLHLIPVPFPSVWHTPADTIEALDRDLCEKISRIIYKFIINKLF